MTNVQRIPKHVAIIMDGNGRWAKTLKLPRVAGHKKGVEAVRQTVTAAQKANISVLTLFAFSKENWQRPVSEVNFLMELFYSALSREIEKLNQSNIRVKFIGDKTGFEGKLQQLINQAELLTQNNTGLVLVMAVNYSGQWDIMQATRQIAQKIINQALSPQDISEHTIGQHLSLADFPPPDLFIRTSGEYRLSNFLIWDLAYTELYFTQTLWPDFNDVSLAQALSWYANRERRFGQIPEQLETNLC